MVSVISIYSTDRKGFHRIDIIEISCCLSPRSWRLPCAVLLENKNRRSLLLWEYEEIKPINFLNEVLREDVSIHRTNLEYCGKSPKIRFHSYFHFFVAQ